MSVTPLGIRRQSCARAVARVAQTIVVALAVLGAVVACGTASTSSSTLAPQPVTSVVRTPDPDPTSPAAVTERPAADCPYLAKEEAAADTGFRLDRMTVLVQRSAIVGCRFYPLQHQTAQCDQACVSAEKLPPGDVPGVEVRLYRYRTVVDAHNAFVRIAEAGTTLEQFEVRPGDIGLCYRTTVWTQDRGTDWACAFSTGSTAVVVRTVVTAPAANVLEIARAVAARL